MLACPSLLMISIDRHSDVRMLVATDQIPSLLWLRPITTNFLKRDLEQIDLFNILHNIIEND
jgi:hypothetical protein